MNLKEKIKNVEYSTTNVLLKQLENAMKKLDMSMTEETKEYFLNFGQLSLDGRELLGLNTDEYLDIEKSTLEEKEYFSNFPQKHFILENIGIDNLLILVNEKGIVFEWNPEGHYKQIFDSIEKYVLNIVEEISRNPF